MLSWAREDRRVGILSEWPLDVKRQARLASCGLDSYRCKLRVFSYQAYDCFIVQIQILIYLSFYSFIRAFSLSCNRLFTFLQPTFQLCAGNSVIFQPNSSRLGGHRPKIIIG